MNLGLKDSVAVVSGSSRGIGRAIAERFLAEGARVVVTGRSPESLTDTTDELAQQYGSERVVPFQGDLGRTEHAQAAIAQAYQCWGRLDSLVLNVGTGTGDRGWAPGEAEWQRFFEANFWPSVRLTEAALPGMIKAKQGTIVFIGSISGLESVGAPLPYAAAKAALVAYAEGLARLIGPAGLRVNCVAPGNILHPGSHWERKLAEDPEGVSVFVEREVPLQRLGLPGEIAGLVVFLCSPAASFVTGSVVVADGGQMRGR